MPFQKRQLPEEEEKAVVGEKALEEEEAVKTYGALGDLSMQQQRYLDAFRFYSRILAARPRDGKPRMLTYDDV